MVNIPPDIRSIKEARITGKIREFKNDFGKIGYGGPCPPSGIHRYIFHLYAMKTSGFNGTRNELFNFIEKNKIAETTLTGLYKRK